MKHLFVLLLLLLTWSGAQAQNDKQTPVTKLPGEENLSLRERAERDFLMPVRRKKIVTEAPKAPAEDNTAAPESDATAHYSDVADEAAVPAHTTRSYEARHTEALAARRAAARREEARLEARAEARAEARRAARHSSRSHSSKLSKSKSHKAATHSSKSKSSKSKAKTKSTSHSSKSTAKSKSSKAKSSSKKSSAKKSSASKATSHKSTKKSTPSKSKVKTKAKKARR